MALTRQDDYVRDRIRRDPEYARLTHESAVDLLGGNDEDQRIALRILRDGFGLIDDEIQALRSAQAGAPRDAAYFIRFGNYKLDACDYAAAIANYDRAIALDPDDPEAYHSRGIAKTEQGDYAGAIADYDRAIALDPDGAAAYHNRGVTKAEQGDYAGAIADYDRAIVLDPDDLAAHQDRAVAKTGLGDHAGAIADYGIDDEFGALEDKEAVV